MSARFLVLGDPTRVGILHLLRRGEATVQELADLLDADRRNVSHHLATLHRAGLLSRRSEGRSAFYSIDDWSALWLIDRATESLADQD